MALPTKAHFRGSDRLVARDSESESADPFYPTLLQTRGHIFSMTADKTVGNSAAEASVFGTGQGTLTLPVDFFTPGKSLRIRMRGYIGTTSTPTLQLKLYAGSVAIADTTALALVALTGNHAFKLEAIITCRTTGATATLIGQIEARYESALAAQVLGSVTTAAVDVDTAAAQVIDLKATWGTANAANTLTMTHASVEQIY